MARRKRDHYKDTDFIRGGFTTASKTAAHLKEIGDHVLQAAKDALEKGVSEIVADAKSRCPVKTGTLRDSIQALSNQDKTEYKISADAKTEKGFLYGQIVEFSPYRSRPFLYPAMDARRQEVIDNIIGAIREAIRRGR